MAAAYDIGGGGGMVAGAEIPVGTGGGERDGGAMVGNPLGLRCRDCDGEWTWGGGGGWDEDDADDDVVVGCLTTAGTAGAAPPGRW